MSPAKATKKKSKSVEVELPPPPPPASSNLSPLRGHSRERRELYQLITSDNLPPTLLFSGLSGIGKRLIALELAAAGLCQKLGSLDPMVHVRGGCGECHSCELVANRSHPDLVLIECAPLGSGETEAIRDLLGTLAMKPFMGSRRFVVLNDADSLSVSSANILLKSLEEPRPGTHFILIAENPGKLPLTVRSRSQVWHFSPLYPEDLKELIKERLHTPPYDSLKSFSIDRLLELADGSLSVLADVAVNIDLWDRVPEITKLLTEGKTAGLSAVVFELGGKREGAEKLVPALIRQAQRQLRGLKTNDERAALAVVISELIEAQHWIDNRNFSPSGILALLLSQFASEQAFTSISSGATVAGRTLGRMNV